MRESPRWPGQIVFPPGTCPFVSIIMPVRNEADFLPESLGAVLSQDYPRDRMEVFVVDGMSTDLTRDIVAEMAARHPRHSVKVVGNPGRIVATGLNAALALARGEVIVRVDGHCRIAEDYVSRCVEHICRDDVDGVGGSINTVATTAIGRVIAAAMSSRFGVGNSAFRTTVGTTMLVDTVPFPAYTRRAIDIAGPYDEELVRNQDDEYNYRLRKLGARLLLASDVRSDYYSRASFRSLWRQYFQYGFFKVRVMQKHVTQMQVRHFIPLAFVLFLFSGPLLGAAGSSLFRLWLLVVAIYGAAMLFASAAAARRLGWSRAWLLPIAFAVLHTSYGLGFLVGLVRFAGRRGALAVVGQPGARVVR